MKQVSFFLLFLTLHSFSLLSQNARFFPSLKDNPKWYLLTEQYNVAGNSTFKYPTLQYQRDTMLCGEQYTLGVLEEKPFFVRTTGAKTYLRNSSNCSKSEELIYDFNMKKGDTLDVKDLYSWAKDRKYKFRVKSVDSVLFEGKKLKRLRMEYAYYNQTFFNYEMDWIEGSGSNEHPFYPLVPLTSYSLDGAKFYTLCTYHHNDLIYTDHTYKTCSSSLLDTAIFPLYKDAAYWNVGRYSSFFPPNNITETDILFYQKDTTICSKLYSKIKFKGQSNNYTAYIRREGRKVYYRPADANCDEDDNLLYNFDLEKGDSELIIHSGDNKEYLYKLTSKESVTFLGKTRQKYTFDISTFDTNIKKGQDIWIEGIGSLIHPFHTFLKPVADGYAFDLLCSYSYNAQQYQNPKYKSCYITSVATNDMSIQNMQVLLSPNPCYNSLNINIIEENNDTFLMELFNSIGQRIMQQNITTQTSLDIDFLPQGTYFIKIKSKDKSKISIQKVIKL